MIKWLYTIEDSTAGEYGQPAPSMNDATATRDFKMLVNEKGTIMNAKPEDFNIYKIGSYNTETGELIPLKPTKIANGASVKEGE